MVGGNSIPLERTITICYCFLADLVMEVSLYIKYIKDFKVHWLASI